MSVVNPDQSKVIVNDMFEAHKHRIVTQKTYGKLYYVKGGEYLLNFLSKHFKTKSFTYENDIREHSLTAAIRSVMMQKTLRADCRNFVFLNPDSSVFSKICESNVLIYLHFDSKDTRRHDLNSFSGVPLNRGFFPVKKGGDYRAIDEIAESRISKQKTYLKTIDKYAEYISMNYNSHWESIKQNIVIHPISYSAESGHMVFSRHGMEKLRKCAKHKSTLFTTNILDNVLSINAFINLMLSCGCSKSINLCYMPIIFLLCPFINSWKSEDNVYELRADPIRGKPWYMMTFPDDHNGSFESYYVNANIVRSILTTRIHYYDGDYYSVQIEHSVCDFCNVCIEKINTMHVQHVPVFVDSVYIRKHLILLDVVAMLNDPRFNQTKMSVSKFLRLSKEFRTIFVEKTFVDRVLRDINTGSDISKVGALVKLCSNGIMIGETEIVSKTTLSYDQCLSIVLDLVLYKKEQMQDLHDAVRIVGTMMDNKNLSIVKTIRQYYYNFKDNIVGLLPSIVSQFFCDPKYSTKISTLLRCFCEAESYSGVLVSKIEPYQATQHFTKPKHLLVDYLEGDDILPDYFSCKQCGNTQLTDCKEIDDILSHKTEVMCKLLCSCKIRRKIQACRVMDPFITKNNYMTRVLAKINVSKKTERYRDRLFSKFDQTESAKATTDTPSMHNEAENECGLPDGNNGSTNFEDECLHQYDEYFTLISNILTDRDQSVNNIYNIVQCFALKYPITFKKVHLGFNTSAPAEISSKNQDLIHNLTIVKKFECCINPNVVMKDEDVKLLLESKESKVTNFSNFSIDLPALLQDFMQLDEFCEFVNKFANRPITIMCDVLEISQFNNETSQFFQDNSVLMCDFFCIIVMLNYLYNYYIFNALEVNTVVLRLFILKPIMGILQSMKGLEMKKKSKSASFEKEIKKKAANNNHLRERLNKIKSDVLKITSEKLTYDLAFVKDEQSKIANLSIMCGSRNVTYTDTGLHPPYLLRVVVNQLMNYGFNSPESKMSVKIRKEVDPKLLMDACINECNEKFNPTNVATIPKQRTIVHVDGTIYMLLVGKKRYPTKFVVDDENKFDNYYEHKCSSKLEISYTSKMKNEQIAAMRSSIGEFQDLELSAVQHWENFQNFAFNKQQIIECPNISDIELVFGYAGFGKTRRLIELVKMRETSKEKVEMYHMFVFPTKELIKNLRMSKDFRGMSELIHCYTHIKSLIQLAAIRMQNPKLRVYVYVDEVSTIPAGVLAMLLSMLQSAEYLIATGDPAQHEPNPQYTHFDSNIIMCNLDKFNWKYYYHSFRVPVDTTHLLKGLGLIDHVCVSMNLSEQTVRVCQYNTNSRMWFGCFATLSNNAKYRALQLCKRLGYDCSVAFSGMVSQFQTDNKIQSMIKIRDTVELQGSTFSSVFIDESLTVNVKSRQAAIVVALTRSDYIMAFSEVGFKNIIRACHTDIDYLVNMANTHDVAISNVMSTPVEPQLLREAEPTDDSIDLLPGFGYGYHDPNLKLKLQKFGGCRVSLKHVVKNKVNMLDIQEIVDVCFQPEKDDNLSIAELDVLYEQYIEKFPVGLKPIMVKVDKLFKSLRFNKGVLYPQLPVRVLRASRTLDAMHALFHRMNSSSSARNTYVTADLDDSVNMFMRVYIKGDWYNILRTCNLFNILSNSANKTTENILTKGRESNWNDVMKQSYLPPLAQLKSELRNVKSKIGIVENCTLNKPGQATIGTALNIHAVCSIYNSWILQVLQLVLKRNIHVSLFQDDADLILPFLEDCVHLKGKIVSTDFSLFDADRSQFIIDLFCSFLLYLGVPIFVTELFKHSQKFVEVRSEAVKLRTQYQNTAGHSFTLIMNCFSTMVHAMMHYDMSNLKSMCSKGDDLIMFFLDEFREMKHPLHVEVPYKVKMIVTDEDDVNEFCHWLLHRCNMYPYIVYVAMKLMSKAVPIDADQSAAEYISSLQLAYFVRCRNLFSPKYAEEAVNASLIWSKKTNDGLSIITYSQMWQLVHFIRAFIVSKTPSLLRYYHLPDNAKFSLRDYKFEAHDLYEMSKDCMIYEKTVCHEFSKYGSQQAAHGRGQSSEQYESSIQDDDFSYNAKDADQDADLRKHYAHAMTWFKNAYVVSDQIDPYIIPKINTERVAYYGCIPIDTPYYRAEDILLHARDCLCNTSLNVFSKEDQIPIKCGILFLSSATGNAADIGHYVCYVITDSNRCLDGNVARSIHIYDSIGSSKKVDFEYRMENLFSRGDFIFHFHYTNTQEDTFSCGQWSIAKLLTVVEQLMEPCTERGGFTHQTLLDMCLQSWMPLFAFLSKFYVIKLLFTTLLTVFSMLTLLLTSQFDSAHLLFKLRKFKVEVFSSISALAAVVYGCMTLSLLCFSIKMMIYEKAITLLAIFVLNLLWLFFLFFLEYIVTLSLFGVTFLLPYYIDPGPRSLISKLCCISYTRRTCFNFKAKNQIRFKTCLLNSDDDEAIEMIGTERSIFHFIISLSFMLIYSIICIILAFKVYGSDLLMYSNHCLDLIYNNLMHYEGVIHLT